jgi:hypothetical protein
MPVSSLPSSVNIANSVVNKIRLGAVVIAFVAELGLDQILSTILLAALGHTDFTAEMSETEQQAFVARVWADGTFIFFAFILGTATTILGGYVCARIAKVFPYYNGLAIGIVGFVFTLAVMGGAPGWYTVLGLLMTLPASIYGAHLAKPHLDAAT